MEQKPFDSQEHMMQYCINEISKLLNASNLEQILELSNMMYKIIITFDLQNASGHPLQKLWGAILFRKNMLENEQALSLNAEG